MTDQITNASILGSALRATVATIAAACNEADALVAKAPFKDLAEDLVGGMAAHTVNETMYLLMNSCLTSGAWNRAKDNTTKAIGKLGYVWKSSGPHYRTRDTKKLPFVLETKAAHDLRTKEAEEAEQQEQAQLQAMAESQRQYERELRDRETTVDDLVFTLVSECERLGLDKAVALSKLAELVNPPLVSTRRVTTKSK